MKEMEATLPQQLARMDAERLSAYKDRLDFYNGLQWPGRARPRERRLTFNYARAFVDKLTAYLMSGMAVVAEPSDSSPESRDRAERAQQVLLEVADSNALEQLDFETELDAAVLGDGAYKLLWDGQEQRVRITAPDVQGLFAWWVADDFARVWRVASRYRLPSADAEAVYEVASVGPETTVVEVWTKDQFALWVDDVLVEERPNAYGFIPIIIFPNLREPKQFWGVSDIPPLMEPQRELNRAFSQLSMILELSGNPVAVLEGVEEARDIAVQPGAVWEIPERARAYL
ncbi:MAG: phage portal protein, partial [Chloroflexi bacterium]|nr:phage portal protein [Chloroflexota bacterium]